MGPIQYQCGKRLSDGMMAGGMALQRGEDVRPGSGRRIRLHKILYDSEFYCKSGHIQEYIIETWRIATMYGDECCVDLCSSTVLELIQIFARKKKVPEMTGESNKNGEPSVNHGFRIYLIISNRPHNITKY